MNTEQLQASMQAMMREGGTPFVLAMVGASVLYELKGSPRGPTTAGFMAWAADQFGAPAFNKPLSPELIAALAQRFVADPPRITDELACECRERAEMLADIGTESNRNTAALLERAAAEIERRKPND